MSEFANLRQEIGHLMVSEGTIEEAEDLLDASRLPSDQVAALWLYAWALMDSEVQRSKAVTYLEFVGIDAARHGHGRVNLGFSENEASHRTELQRLAAAGAARVELDAALARAGDLSDTEYAELWAYAWALSRQPPDVAVERDERGASTQG